MERHKHDAAFAASHRVVGIFSPLLRGEECNEAFAEVYRELRAMLEDYEARKRREEARLCKPSQG